MTDSLSGPPAPAPASDGMEFETADGRMLATQRALRVGANPDAPPGRRQRIDHQQVPGKAGPDAQQLLDHLGRLQPAQSAAEGAEDTGFGTARDLAEGRRLAVETAVA